MSKLIAKGGSMTFVKEKYIEKIQFLYLFSCLLLCNCQDNSSTLDDLIALLEAEEAESKFDQYKICTHTSGAAARCVNILDCRQDFDVRILENKSNTQARETVGSCNNPEICCPEVRIMDNENQQKVPKITCGYSNPDESFLWKRKDGSASFGDFPWMVALLKTQDRYNLNFRDVHIGGGSIIHPSVVLTVAHKVDEIYQPEELLCRAGEWDITSNKEPFMHQDRVVKNIIRHKAYSTVDLRNNIVLLILAEAFELSGPHIGIACLHYRMPDVGTKCYGAGWGVDPISKQYVTQLKKVELPIVDSKKCETMYRHTRVTESYKLHRSLTCAGGDRNIDMCLGDGGSPLMCPISSNLGTRYAVAGMAVYGLECGRPNLPGVFVKIPLLYNWVIKEMRNLGYEEYFNYKL